MPRYITKDGVVVDYPESYIKVFAPGVFTSVPDETPLTQMECCGGSDWDVDDTVAAEYTSATSTEEITE